MFVGTESGAGKTTIVTGLLRYWTQHSLRVQPFKVGPDYIDPSFHTAAAMKVSRNLDSWLLSQKNIESLFCQHSKQVDLSVIEGMMGLYDGHSSTNEEGSSAQIAKWLDCPVILIIDASKMARSAAAVVKGFQQLDKKVLLAGVVFNNVSSQGHYQLLKKAVEKETSLLCLGFVKPNPKLALPEQHLGLVPVEAAFGKLKTWFDLIAKEVAKNIDHEKLLKIAKKAPVVKSCSTEPSVKKRLEKRVKIAYAKDEAFHFYYPDNIEVLESLGAEMIPFSPIYENKIPDDVDALYLGGGFPENYAKEIAQNRSMLQSVRRALKKGLPTYAECGGLMYLCERLVLQNKKSFKMVGALPGKIVMTHQLQNFGYTFVEAARDSLLFKKGEKCRGHEFHNSYWQGNKKEIRASYKTKKRAQGPVVSEGMITPNVLASYIHLHFVSKPVLAKRFIEQALLFGRCR